MRHRTTPGPCRGMSCARGCCSRWRRRSGWRVRARARGEALVGWQRWRRPLLAQTRDPVIVCAYGDDGIFPLACHTRGCWECSATMSCLTSAAAHRSWPSIGSQHGTNRSIGTSANGDRYLDFRG
jgi:hypothetical protein